MGFLKAFGGALGGSFANQWLEYMAPPANMTDHVLLARARAVKVNGSENNDGEENGQRKACHQLIQCVVLQSVYHKSHAPSL